MLPIDYFRNTKSGNHIIFYMLSDNAKKIKSDLFKFGLYQIIGGAVGIILIIPLLFNIEVFSALYILILLFMFSFFAYSIFCGILCLQKKEKALQYSLINQVLQIFGFAAFSFAFSYIAGLYLTIGFDFSDSFNVTFGFGISKFDFNINRESERTEISFNLIAIVIVYYVDKLIKNIKAEKEIQKVDELGKE